MHWHIKTKPLNHSKHQLLLVPNFLHTSNMKIAILVLACVAASQAKFQYAFATPYYGGYNSWAHAAYPVVVPKFAEPTETKTPASTVSIPAFYSSWPYAYPAAAYTSRFQYFTNPWAPVAAAAAPQVAPAAKASSDNKQSLIVESAPAKEEPATRKKRDLAYYVPSPYAYSYGYQYAPVKSVVAPARFVAPVAVTRDATLTKTVLNPGHAVAYRVD